MKFVGLLLFLCLAVGGSMKAMSANNTNKKDHAAAVAGTYNGEAFVEIMQQKMKLKLELQRTQRDRGGERFCVTHGAKVQLSFHGCFREAGSKGW